MAERLFFYVLGLFLVMTASPSAAQRTRYIPFGVQVGYQQTDFINKSYFNNLNSGLLDKKFGWSAGLYGQIGIVLWDLGYFRTGYKVNAAGLALPEDVSIRNDGLDIGLSLKILPKFRYFCPLLGAGYHSSSLRANKSSQNTSFSPFSANTSGFLWRVGVHSRLADRIALVLSYRQSIPKAAAYKGEKFYLPEIVFSDRDRAVRQFSVSVLFLLQMSVTTY